MKADKVTVENPFIYTRFDRELTPAEIKQAKDEIAAAGGTVSHVTRRQGTTVIGWRSGKNLDMLVIGPFEVGG